MVLALVDIWRGGTALEQAIDRFPDRARGVFKRERDVPFKLDVLTHEAKIGWSRPPEPRAACRHACGAARCCSRRACWREPKSDKKEHRASDLFSAAAQWTSRQCGRASTFVVACLTIVAWAVTGPVFHYSDTWQLIINTGTTIVTFLMVFLIQNTQNRDMSALHLKLDELIRVNEDARNKLLNLEDLTEEELEKLKGTFERLAVSNAVQPQKAEAALADLEDAEADIGEAKRKIGAG